MRLFFAVLFSLWALAFTARAAPPVEVYGKLPALDLVRLSPSGERIAFIAVDGEKRKLFVRKTGGDALLVNPVGNTKIRDLEWAGEDYVLVIASIALKYGPGDRDMWHIRNRYETGLIFVADLKTGKVWRVLADNKTDTFGGAAVHLGSRQIDGRWYEFVASYNLRMGVFYYRVDLETGAAKPMPQFQGADLAYLIDADGKVAARSHYSQSTRTWELFAGGSGLSRVVGRHSDLDQVEALGLGRTPGTVVVAESGDQDTLDEYPASPAASATPLFPGLEYDSLINDPATHLLIGAVLQRDQGAVFVNPALQRRYDAVRKAFPGLHLTFVSASSGLDKIVVQTDGGDDPGTYWLVDMATGKADDLMPAYAIDAKDVGATSIFKFQAADGQAMEGVLTLPPGSQGKSLPLVVMPHGGPIGVYDWLGFNYWAQAFASRGYAVFQPNYRGSEGYGATFRQAGFGEYGKKMLSDINDGVAALAKSGVADPKRMCIAGASYGGYAALAEVTVEHAAYRCAVAVSAVTDVGAIMTRDGDSQDTASGRYVRALFGASFGGSVANSLISPVRHASEADAPILLIHGKDDDRVPFVHSQDMAEALRVAGKTVEFLPLEGEDHFWSHEATRIQILAASVAFVQKYNPVQ
jgi:dipeptidyl aminopeptidase/acylaminoacyl peptidase